MPQSANFFGEKLLYFCLFAAIATIGSALWERF